jgi:hypothetical protein
MTEGKRQAHDKDVQMVLKAGNPELIAKVVLEFAPEARNQLIFLVAGEGFEPSTFGL